METMINKDANKQFSKIGLVLFLGTLLIYGVQAEAMILSEKVLGLSENTSLSFLVIMLSMYIIAYPIIFLMLKKVPVQMSGEKKKMPVHHLVAAFFICYAGNYCCSILGTVLTSIVGLIKQSPVDNVVMNVTSRYLI